LIAFDTNILIYAEDPHDPNGRHEIAVQLLEKLSFDQNIIPVQVLGEFLNVCRIKRIISLDLAASKITNYAKVFETPSTQIADLESAVELSPVYNLQYFDALIIAVASRAGATILLSEDMQDGLEVNDLRIVNPFVFANETLLADYFGNAL
jgi:predicted nucleic acid-binding protein